MAREFHVVHPGYQDEIVPVRTLCPNAKLADLGGINEAIQSVLAVLLAGLEPVAND